MPKCSAMMRTILTSVQHIAGLFAPIKNPASDRMLNNLDSFPPGYRSNFVGDAVYGFSNRLRFGVQRYCSCLNLAFQILTILLLKQLSLTINNFYAIKTC